MGCHYLTGEQMLWITGILVGAGVLWLIANYGGLGILKSLDNRDASKYDARVEARAQEFIKDWRKAEAEDEAARVHHEEQRLKASRAGSSALKAWSDKAYADACFRVDVKRRVHRIKAGE